MTARIKGVAIKYAVSVLALLALNSPVAGADRVQWPALAGIPFIEGRAATEEDVDNRSAVFVLKADDLYIGTPIDIELPQYALYHNEKGEAEQVIVIQAEEAQGKKVLGAVQVKTGQYLVGLFHDFELLGTDGP